MLVRHRSYTPTLPRTFDRSFDRAFDQLANSFFDTARPNGPVVDGAWLDDEYVLTVDLPGVPAQAISVEVTGSTLTLSAATDTLDWTRSVRLGGRLDPDQVRARHLDGRLTVRIGTVTEPEARAIAIDTAAPAHTSEPAIAVTSSEADDQSIDTTVTE